jgi:hypothetical protein
VSEGIKYISGTLRTLLDFELALDFLDCFARALEHASRGLKVLEQLWMRRREGVLVDVRHDRGVELGLLNAVYRGVVRQTRVEPRCTVSAGTLIDE